MLKVHDPLMSRLRRSGFCIGLGRARTLHTLTRPLLPLLLHWNLDPAPRPPDASSWEPFSTCGQPYTVAAVNPVGQGAFSAPTFPAVPRGESLNLVLKVKDPLQNGLRCSRFA